MLTLTAPRPRRKEAEICGVCEANVLAKYKCPKSKTPYCSVPCYKKLREKAAEELAEKLKNLEEGEELVEDEVEEVAKVVTEENDNDSRNPFKANFSEEEQVPPKLLDYLGSDVAMRNLLKNKHLRDILK